MINTTNAIESLNSVIRNKLFPSDDSAGKVVYLAILGASKKWPAHQKLEGVIEPLLIEYED